MLALYLSLLDDNADKTKIELIYYKYRNIMKYIAMGILKDSGLAEDAVHNAFLKLIKYIKKIDDINCQKTKGLIFIIIQSVSLDMLKKVRRERGMDLENYSTNDSYEDSYFTNFSDSDIYKFINNLPASYSQIIVLKYVCDYSDKDIAKTLNLSNDTVRKKLQRSRETLKKILEEKDYEGV